jgi:hypothetical protein
MMALRSEKDRYALAMNVVFTGLTADGPTASGAFYDVDVSQDMIELAWSWRLDERYELYVGGRNRCRSTFPSSSRTAAAMRRPSPRTCSTPWWAPALRGRSDKLSQ